MGGRRRNGSASLGGSSRSGRDDPGNRVRGQSDPAGRTAGAGARLNANGGEHGPSKGSTSALRANDSGVRRPRQTDSDVRIPGEVPPGCIPSAPMGKNLSEMAVAEKRRTSSSLASLVRNRLRGADGLRVIGSGTLSRSNGHPRGSTWVEIEADSILDCDVAQYRLSRLQDLRPAPWENGWSLAENRQRDPSFRLRLYARNR